MPRTLDMLGGTRSVATEEELLAFANAIRQAGGANVLEALLPSEIGNSEKCIIATALNFGCSVEAHPDGHYFKDESGKWVMWLPYNLTKEQRKALASVEGVRLRQYRSPIIGEDFQHGLYYLTLPKHIGNAAQAFDEGVAFQQYRIAEPKRHLGRI